MAGWALLLLPWAVAGLHGAAAAQTAQVEGSSLEQDLRRCRTLVEMPARLACYEAISLPVAPRASASASAPGSSPAPTASRPIGAAAASTVAVSAAAALSAPTATVADAQHSFGLPERPSAGAPEAMDSAIAGVFEGWTAGSRLRLVNGQIWEIADGSTASYQLRDPKIRVTRGVLGSFFMRIEGVAQSPRVRRIQ